MLLRLLGFFTLLTLTGFSLHAQETVQPVTVKVGGYEFEPFVEKDLGITPAFLTLLNQMQNDYVFEFVNIPARRRYAQLRDGNVDAIFFEMPRWGWQEHADKIEVSKPILQASEAFYARVDHAEGMEVFSHVRERKLALTLGYHYAFANFNSDQAYIRENFNASFAPSQRVALRLTLAGSTDMVIMSDIFLFREMARNPSLKGQLVRAPEVDQAYALPLMVRKFGPVSVAYLEDLIARAAKEGTLESFFKTFGSESLLIPIG